MMKATTWMPASAGPLHDAISNGWTAARAGRVRPAQEIIDALRRR